jgi:hypothetical protein
MSTFKELSKQNDKIEYYHFRKLFNLLLGCDIDVYKQLEGYSYDNKYDFTINDQKIHIYNKIDKNKKVVDCKNQHDIDSKIESEDSKKISYHILNPENNTTCAFLVINKEKKKAYISMIYGDDGCAEEYEIKTNIGTLLLQSIIELCKNNKIKEIYLNDESTYYCNKPEKDYRITLFKARTLIEGSPWYCSIGALTSHSERYCSIGALTSHSERYCSFGFRYCCDREHNIILLNQELHSYLLTKDLFELQINFMELIKKVLSDKYKFENLSIESKKIIYKEIKVLFNDYQDKSFGSFCKVLNEKYCELFYYIYEDLFDKIGYNYIDKAYMILDLE